MLALAGCARLEQSRLGQFTPDLDFRKEGPLRFAILNDFHLLDSRSVGIVGRAVNAINNDESIDFVVVLGDITTHGTLPEMNLAQQALARLKVPAHCLPGHQDHVVDGNESLDFFHRTFKKSQWRLNMGSWTLLGIDTSSGRDDSAPMSDANLAWLDDQLAHLDATRPVALLCHHPLSPNTKGGRLANADAVLERFQGHNLRLVASGHYHGNQVEEKDNILFVTTAPCSTQVKNEDDTSEKGFRVVTLDQAQIQHEFVAVPG